MDKPTLMKTYENYFFLADPEAMEVLLAGVNAYYMEGLAIWLLYIGAFGFGKSTVLEMFDGHERTYGLDELTNKSLQSGLADKSEEDNLVNLLDGKVALISDLAQIINLKNTQGEIMAQLRRVYDGSLTKVWGSNKASAKWEGQVGLIAAATDVIDNKMSVFADLGERFNRVNVRGTKKHRKEAVRRARESIGRESEMRRALREAGHSFLDRHIALAEGYEVDSSSEYNEQLEVLADVTANLRTPITGVKGGGFNHIPEPEYATRLVKQLGKLAKSNAMLDGEHHIGANNMELVLRVAVDAIPRNRIWIISALINGAKNRAEISRYSNIPASTLKNEVDKLQALNILHLPDGKIALLADVEEDLIDSGIADKMTRLYPAKELK